MPPPQDFNYSIGVLIVLLLFFWFVCKCIGGKRDAMNSVYGDKKIRIVNTPYADIRSTSGGVYVPNSQDAMNKLVDDERYACAAPGKDMTSFHMAKKSVDANHHKPISLTKERFLHDDDYSDLLPMASY